MKRLLKIAMLGCAFFLSSCAQWERWEIVPPLVQEPPPPPPPAPIDPAERHIWTPPSDEELAARHRRQETLDAMSSDLEKLFMQYAHTLGEEIILENLVAFHQPKVYHFDASLQQEIGEVNAVHRQNVEELNKSREALKRLEQQVDNIQKQREARRFKPDDYRRAIILFRDAHYRASIAVFNRILNTDFPRELHDNILFGLGSSYYRLREYDRAQTYFEPIVEDHAATDKWLPAHAMLGMVYNLKGHKSRALYVIEKALEQKPTGSLLEMLENIKAITKGKEPNASS